MITDTAAVTSVEIFQMRIRVAPAASDDDDQLLTQSISLSLLKRTVMEIQQLS